jgi:hypothetical protein
MVIVGACCGVVVEEEEGEGGGGEVRGAATGGTAEDSAPPHAHARAATKSAMSAMRFRIKSQVMILPERKIDRERVVTGSAG